MMTQQGEAVTQSGIINQVDQRTRLSWRTGSDWRGDDHPAAPTASFVKVSSGGGVSCQEWHTRPTRIGYVHGVATTDTYLTIEPNRPGIHLVFTLEGTVAYGYRADTSRLTGLLPFASQQHNVLTVMHQSTTLYCAAGQPISTVIVWLDLAWLVSQLAEGIAWETAGRRGSPEQNGAWLSSQPLPLTPRMLAILHELINDHLPNAYRSIYLNGKMMELLALQLDGLRQRTTVPATADVPDTMQEKMQQVRDLLLGNLASAPSIRELARQVGTNEFSLKQGFKTVFNTTVFNYLQQARMEKARQLLTTGETKIAEVAHSLGYKHATHFTAAFKKHFGFLPNKIRVVLLLLPNFELDLTCLLAC